MKLRLAVLLLALLVAARTLPGAVTTGCHPVSSGSHRGISANSSLSSHEAIRGGNSARVAGNKRNSAASADAGQPTMISRRMERNVIRAVLYPFIYPIIWDVVIGLPLRRDVAGPIRDGSSAPNNRSILSLHPEISRAIASRIARNPPRAKSVTVGNINRSTATLSHQVAIPVRAGMGSGTISPEAIWRAYWGNLEALFRSLQGGAAQDESSSSSAAATNQ